MNGYEARRLFNQDVIEGRKTNLEEHLMGIRELVKLPDPESLADSGRVEIPVLGDPKLTAVEDARVPAGREAWARDVSPDFLLDGKRVLVTIPFDGNYLVFQHQPSTRPLSSHPEGQLSDDKVVLHFYVVTHGIADLKDIESSKNRERQQLLRNFNSWFGFAKTDFEEWNAGLLTYVTDAIQARDRHIVREGMIDRTLLNDKQSE